ncbi:rhizoferrin biosystnesis N-citrylornithine decarboxylase FslC [Francisella adeliensis]|uniref:Diaminopimelate decarboxylase n=1 Tax=Francisella adeliensis TaxID=2007306 RepID=A0A2Z4Y1K5_9GAMM|nr:rhizoferrin biosystnesis N-citrylornithine decarboxylase FslC [Francisella adeliensis]AXA34612.1 diaminopimelate decarboxylase [Francisella adeliensis]MBK2086338.1 diaminopimelate decarboxylase [Francisella adeliensis]MBK2096553.1 diaminopimelate decarboxylase [Francisella adeliensis]QIW12856.1 diaminopimelate decarboxylase [Francisella adeliensis]QIW14733.1 diaminopimelate decarboxylase [Francisella adeliensis]
MSKLETSNSIFKDLSKNKIEEITHLYGSPCFIVSEKALLDRAKLFKKTITNHYQNSIAAYSVKTQSLPGIINIFCKNGFVPEVVSSDEFELIEKLNLNNSNIIFNGPYKTDESLTKAILSNSIINCDHFGEILRIAEIAKKLKTKVNIGIRICDNTTTKNWSRFGFPLTNTQSHDNEILKTIDKIKNIPELNFSGIHCHIGTNIRDLSRFEAMSQNIAKLAETILVKYNQTLDWIDFGGGLAGISPRLDDTQIEPYHPFDLEIYASTVINPLKEYLAKTNNKTKLIFELGRSLVDYSTALITSVVGVREQNNKYQTLITNAGIHIAPTTSVYRHPVYHTKPTDLPNKKTLLLGPSCMQHDLLSETYLPHLEYGDHVLVDGLGAYNISRNNEFIHLKPSVILVKKDNQYEILRAKQTH